MMDHATKARLHIWPSTLEAGSVLLNNLGWLVIPFLLPDVFHWHLGFLLLGPFLALRLRSLHNIIHECSHSAFHAREDVNRWVGGLLCILLVRDFQTYKLEHGTHHRFLGNYDKDLDLRAVRHLDLHKQPGFPISLERAFHPDFVRAYLPRFSFSSMQRFVGSLLLIAVIATFASAPWPGRLLTLLAGYFVFYPVVLYLMDIVDHGGLFKNERMLQQTRNLIVDSLLFKWIFFPRNDFYHLIHHLYPRMPVKFFPNAHKKLLEQPEYAALMHYAFGKGPAQSSYTKHAD